MTRRWRWCLALLLLVPLVAAAAQVPVELLFDDGRRMFDQLEYDKAKRSFDQVITAMLGEATLQKPEMLAQAYDLRAQSRFALGDQIGAEQDLIALLRVVPDYKLAASVSPRVVALFENKRRTTVGQVSVSLNPPGDAQIDGRPYALRAEPLVVDLTLGEHRFVASKPGYESVTQTFMVTAGETVALPVVLTRTSATLAITSIPDDVEVIFDGERRGLTRKGDASSPESAPLVLSDLAPGVHRLQLRRACYVPVERQINIERPMDLRVGPLSLVPAVANVKVESPQAGAAVLLDGVVKGQAPLQLSDMCEGPHTIEVRASNGRFVDRREWKAGDTATLTAVLRSVFPIVAVTTSPGRNPDTLRAEVERALGTTRNLMVYAPTAAELQAVQAELANVPAGWLSADPGAAPRTPRDVSRELGRTLATKLDAQGLTTINVASNPSVVRVAILASGSGEPDVLLLNLTDSASRARLIEALAAPLPPLLMPSIETAVVDLAGVRGAVVIQASGVGAKAGLAAGDSPIASVAELRARIAAVQPPGTELSLDVKGSTGTARKATVAVAMLPDATQWRDPAPLSNLALVELQRALTQASTPADRSAVLLNLAIVHMRLSNWTEADSTLAQVQLPEGRGVSAGTIAYLRGRCLEELGRIVEAQAQYTAAAAANDARLWNDGPLVAPLALQRLQARR